jgi:hypothetical protein
MKRVLLFFAVLICACNLAQAQGCSDAGFCSAGSMKSGGDQSQSDFTLSLPFALGEQLASIFIIQPELNYKIGEKQKIQIKLAYQFVSGNLGNTHGLGDPIVTYSRIIKEKNDWISVANLGGRFAVDNANKKSENNRPLPMPYQTSLGTYDLIAGLAIKNDHWNFAIGYQQPLVQNNNNSFYHDLTASIDELKYFESRHLERKGDIMIRAERTEEWKKFKITAGFLPIYHLGKDVVSTSLGKTEIANSEGLTLNINFNLSYKLKENAFIGLVGASPLIVRTNRPDGLTRAFVASPYFIFKF